MSFDAMTADEGLERLDRPQAQLQAEHGQDEPPPAGTDRAGRLFRVGVILLCAAFWLAVAYLIF